VGGKHRAIQKGAKGRRRYRDTGTDIETQAHISEHSQQSEEEEKEKEKEEEEEEEKEEKEKEEEKEEKEEKEKEKEEEEEEMQARLKHSKPLGFKAKQGMDGSCGVKPVSQ
jgi:hypothetical protein